MMNNIIKNFDIVVVIKVHMHMFLIFGKGEDVKLGLLLVDHIMSYNPQFLDHMGHDVKMLPHRMARAVLYI